MLRSQGRFGEARELDTYVLERQRAVLGPDHPHALMTAGGLAADLRALGEFQEALASDQETYDSFKEQFGEDYPRTLAAAHNLAVSLRLVGDCFAARRLDEETLARARRSWAAITPTPLLGRQPGPGHARGGRSGTPSTCCAHTWNRYRAVLGEDMLDTLRTAKSLAVSLRKAGEQARRWT